MGNPSTTLQRRASGLTGLLATAILVVHAAANAPGETAIAQSGGQAGTLVGLPLSPFKGMTRPEQAFYMMEAGGANFIEVRKEWAELERAPERVSFAIDPFPLLEKARKSHPALFTGFVVNLQVCDTAIRTMPRDLSTNGFDDTAVIDRFRGVIEKLAEYHKSFPVTYVIVGHEADIYLSNHSNEARAFETFYKFAVEQIHRLMPGVGVGTSMTFDRVKGNKSLFDNLNRYSDLMVYTYYPLGNSWHMRPVEEVKDDLQLLASRAGRKNFAMLEIGYSANDIYSGSEDKQARFVETVFRTLDPYRLSGQLKFLEYWMMFDFPPDLSVQAARAQGSSDKNMVAYLSSLGLRRYDAGGAKRPAWDVFSSMAKAWTTGQPLPK
jgi:hypothetical protein